MSTGSRAARLLAIAALVAGGLFAPVTAVAQLAGADRDQFVSSSIESCTSAIKKSGATLPDATIASYCTCMANREADMTTQDDMAYVVAHNAASPDYTQRVQALAPACKSTAGIQ